MLLRSLISEVERISRKAKAKPHFIGLALPGGVHPKRGIVALPGKLDGLEGPLVPNCRGLSGFRLSLKTMDVFPFSPKNTMDWPEARSGWSR